MGLFGGSKFDKAFREYEMPKEPNFWQGGEKFRAKDGIAALLAAIGDGLSQANGGQAWATRNLAGGRFDAMEEAKKRAAEQEQLQAAYATADRLGVSRDMVDAKRYGVPVPEQDIPPMVRDVEAWQKMSPEKKRAAYEMYSARSPYRVMGKDGLPYDMGNDGLPDILTDDDINRLSGGGTGNGAGGFRYPR